ncbi:hypothetical protein [Bathymodiolus japonicus methanotrophic gill symbiont]|uniref:hypothetical protein n=1 Tax=Bathymodiolus japonicus methanotrophic gill symbiont TaxID=113269 RepID=UPI001E3D314A|nr:hypothetical protein [Bathymodiolus japonicus methanotrophic gill symbiont]
MGDALNALRPQRLRTKAASSLLPHWLDGYSECNSCSSRVLLAHVESANCPVAYQGLKITTSLSSVSMIFSEGIKKVRVELPLILEDSDNDLTDLSREMFAEQYEKLVALDEEIKQQD